GTTPATRAVAEERLRRVAQVITRRTGTAPDLPTEQLLALLGYPEQPGAELRSPELVGSDRTVSGAADRTALAGLENSDLAGGEGDATGVAPTAAGDSRQRRRNGAPEAVAE